MLDNPVRFLDLTLDINGDLWRGGEQVPLDPAAARVLIRLAATPWETVPLEVLTRLDGHISHSAVQSYVSDIRGALKRSEYVRSATGHGRIAADAVLVTHHRVGYEFRPPLPIIDFRGELDRHRRFVARDAVMHRLDQCFVDPSFDRGYIVLLGSPGIGKSAIVTHWLRTRGPQHRLVLRHFVRRGIDGWDKPQGIVRNLLAQIDANAPLRREFTSLRQQLLVALERHATANPGHRLCILIDGLDEIAPEGPDNPLVEILPESLPLGVHVLCTSRPTIDISYLEGRECVHYLDLDTESWRSDNQATCRAYWERLKRDQVTALPWLTDNFIADAVAAADGSMLYTIKLHEALADSPRQADDRRLPIGVAGFLREQWLRIDERRAGCARAGLQILCLARESLTLDDLERVFVAVHGDGWSREEFLRHGRPFILRTAGPHDPGRADRYRLFHEAFREYVASTMDRAVARRWHRGFMATIAAWPAAPAWRSYALSHAIHHQTYLDDPSRLIALCFDLDLLRGKLSRDGVEGLEADLGCAAEQCLDIAAGGRIDDLGRAVVAQAHWLLTEARAIGELLQSALRCAGWPLEASRASFHGRHTPDVWLAHPIQHTDRPVRLLAMPGRSAWDCRVSRNATTALCVAYRDIFVWDLASGRVRGTLQGHTGMPLGCAISPDLRWYASGGLDCTVRVWDARTMHERHVLPARSVVGRLAFAPDGQIVAPCWDGTLAIWDATDGRLVRRIPGHEAAVIRCVVAPDGGRIISASLDGSVAVWERESGRELMRLRGHTRGVLSCDLDANGLSVVTGGQDDTIRVWDLHSGRCRASWAADQAGINHCIFFGSDGADGEIVSAGNDGSIKCWTAAGDSRSPLPGHPLGVHALAEIPRTSHLLTAGYDGVTRVWDMNARPAVSAAPRHSLGVTHCRLSPDRMRAYSVSDDCTIRIWDVASGHCVHVLRGDAGIISAWAIDPRERLLAAGTEDGVLCVWILDGQFRRILREQDTPDWVTACAFSSAGDALFAASADGTVQRRSLDSGDRVVVRMDPERAVSCSAIGRGRIVFGLADGTLEVWHDDLTRPRTLHGGSRRAVTRCTLAERDDRVAWIAGDKRVAIRSVDGHGPEISLEHTEMVLDCRFLADSSWIVTASADATLRLWDVSTRRIVRVFHGNAAFLSLDVGGGHLIAGDVTGNLWFFEASGPHGLIPRSEAPCTSSA